MMNLGSKEVIVQNLKDAGCGIETIQEFLLYFNENQKEKQLELLEKQRGQLLSNVHREEKKIYCLDYLVCQMKNKEKKR